MGPETRHAVSGTVSYVAWHFMDSKKRFGAIKDSYLASSRAKFQGMFLKRACSARISVSGCRVTPRAQTKSINPPDSPTAMPHKIPNSSETQAAKAERARQLLRTGGVARDDSDDELGLEDHPWEWIYAENDQDDAEDEGIVGARMGNFECKIGDCVLLKAEGVGEAWIGLICDFQDDEDGEKAANFMWFSTEREIRNKERKRKDFLPVG